MKHFCATIRSIPYKETRLCILLLITMFLMACGSSDQSSVTPKVRITISAPSESMDQGATRQFTATVTGSSNNAVVWSVMEGSAGGAIDSTGKYTAPANSGTFHVVATSAADARYSASREVSVNSVAIAVSPGSADIEPGATQQFVATVTGTVYRDLIWSVEGGEDAGTITNAGLYTAPLIPGTFRLIVMSNSDKSVISYVELTVANLAVVVTPRAAGVLPSSTRTFSATVQGCSDDRVDWFISEGSSGGVITSAGIYTAPTRLGEYHLVATSIAHPSISTSATVKVLNSGFTNAAEMTRPRSNHTATLMPNGDVLLVGGEVQDDLVYLQEIKEAEIYDHLTKTFRATGSLTIGRSQHTATLLSNGKVLITGGGIGGWKVLDSAELYDPATGQFAMTGEMVYHRTAHTATLLANGKVLIIGGADSYMSDAPEPTDIAEIYDPETGSFSATGRLTEPRFGHTATLLPDGRVLVAGGSTDWVGGTTNSTEIYDPANGTFTSASSFAGERESHTSTWISDNRVLMSGGLKYTENFISWQIFIYEDAQVLDTATGQFTPAISTNSPRARHTATLLPDGTVLVAGGFSTVEENNSTEPNDTAELFDPKTGEFMVSGTMAKPRAGHTATMLPDGKILITGGTNDRTTEVFSQQLP